MLLPVLLLAAQSAMSPPGAACEVLKDAGNHLGERFTFKGLVTSYEHGMYFVPDPSCAEHEAIRIQYFPLDAYHRAGGTKGVGVLATVQGKIVAREIQLRLQKKGRPTKETVFSVKHVSDLKPAPVTKR